MAYIDQRTGGNQKLVTMTVVALIQGAVAIALVNGLAVKWMKPDPVPRTEATDVPVTMPLDPPPPPPKPTVKQPDTVIDAVKPLVGAKPNDQVVINFPLDPPPFPKVDEFVRPVDPPPTPTATFTPRAPKPRNAPGSWATTNDYPSRDLREGNQGVVGFLLSIGADGKVLSCQVTRSSNFPGLDKATCDNVSRRARFDPATDGSGARVQGTYPGTIRWEIPQD